jgi:hypothetical protein
MVSGRLVLRAWDCIVAHNGSSIFACRWPESGYESVQQSPAAVGVPGPYEAPSWAAVTHTGAPAAASGFRARNVGAGSEDADVDVDVGNEQEAALIWDGLGLVER